MAQYNNTSPYYSTTATDGYLNVMTYRDFPAETDDVLYSVTGNYNNRPDLLSYDLYGDVGYWWVFAYRNPGILKDPVYDLVNGVEIYLPKITTLKKYLGT